MGLPGFSGFIAEVLVFLGAFKSASANGILHESLAIVATLGLILSAAYYLWTTQRMFFGPFYARTATTDLTDLSKREYLMLIPLAVAAVLFGIFPQTLLNFINPFAQQLVQSILETGASLTSNR
jgi:NADH-quinone oxidoreductase subunit M